MIIIWTGFSLSEKTTLPKNSKLILNVPDFSLKNIPYEIPESVKDLQSSTFIINYYGKDELQRQIVSSKHSR